MTIRHVPYNPSLTYDPMLQSRTHPCSSGMTAFPVQTGIHIPQIFLFSQPFIVLHETCSNCFYCSKFSSNCSLFKIILAKHILLFLQVEPEIFRSALLFSVPGGTEGKNIVLSK